MTPSPVPAHPVDDAGPRVGNAPTASQRSWWTAAAVTLVAAVATAVAFPGDVSFINDEPRLLANAFHANAGGGPAVHGLQGNFRVTYGPAATHIYQLLLLVTHDPLTFAAVRAGVSAAATAAGLLWLARGLRLNPWFATAVVLAPFLWVFHRILWDASWAIPVGTLGLAAYAAYLRHGRAAALAVAVSCTLFVPFIHPQDCLLALPVGLHMLWRNWRPMLRQWPAVLVPAAVVLGLNYPYLHHARDEVRRLRQEGETVGRDYPLATAATPLEAYLAPFLSGRILSGHKFVEGGFAGDTVGEWLVRASKDASHVIYPLIWGGTAVAAWRLIDRRRRRRRPHDVAEPARITPTPGRSAPDSGPPSRSPDGFSADGDPDPAGPAYSVAAARDALGGIALASAVLQALLFGAKRIPIEPQYFFGTFPLHVLLAWYAVDALRRVRLGGVATAAYGLSVAAITVGSIWVFDVRPLVSDSIKASRPEHLTLGTQVDAARALSRYADAEVLTDVVFFQRTPQALRALRLLVPPDPAAPRSSTGRLVLTFADGPGRPGAPGRPASRLVVFEARTPADVPPGARPMTVTPLPEGWLPPWPADPEPTTRPATPPATQPGTRPAGAAE